LHSVAFFFMRLYRQFW